ncbi:CAP domain-containing protein [Octadecabacter sp. B2R22]|nr:CAP domain-containing protein [Octadecabacter sp. B2R22]
MLNAARADTGLGPVRENARLSQAARFHATDMVANDYFSHTGRTGSSFTDRARAAGYACAAAENIASGQETESEVFTTWMNSSGHRRNILLRDAREFGIGRVGNMWVLMMGRGC